MAMATTINKKWLLVLLLVSLLCIPGCVDDLGPLRNARVISLTVRCDESVLTKAVSERDGERRYHENLVKSVDFLFYPGDSYDENAPAVFHIRKELSEDPMVDGVWEVGFDLVLKRTDFVTIFPDQVTTAKVYALVNFEDSFIPENLSGTSKDDLAARVITTDFVAEEVDFVQPHFLMDGQVTLTNDGNPDHPITGRIDVRRFAAKLTFSVNVAPRIELKHSSVGGATPAQDEIWTPVLHSMRVYLVDGVKTVKLSGLEDDVETGKYITYSDKKRPFVMESGDAYVGTSTVGEGEQAKTYYDTYPMYSYPRTWSKDWPNTPGSYQGIDYTQGLPTEQPYFKLEMDWRRLEENGYSYDRRKYYYKIFLPFESLERNHWYAFFLDVGILGSETDEGKALINPSCYVLDWQNRAEYINKVAVISKARYLSVETDTIILHNLETYSLPFLSSHNVKFVEGSIRATRPYYGEVTNESSVLNHYDATLHAWIRKDADGNYYLDYLDDTEPQSEAYDPRTWLDNSSTSIDFTHPLQNDYTLNDFDYSPYTVSFSIVHEDLRAGSDLFGQYVKHITIIQYPAIYIEALENRDTEIRANPGNTANPYGYGGTPPEADKPWGYVYIDGGRFIRWDKLFAQGSQDPFYTLTTNNNKREYQWRTVWYTGGSRNLFKINVSVLPSSSPLIIGDPRTDEPVDLDYHFVRDGTDADAQVLTYASKDGFCVAPDVNGVERTLENYYPADETMRTEYMLAPSYRIASKFGGTEYGQGFFEDIDIDHARYRCAAYQEDGFPAGRWRLPTKGEILFIAQLSANGAFAPLFSFRSTYWSAHGAITVNKGDDGQGRVTNSSAKKALLRCVYDSWYWGDDQYDPNVFVWGDQSK